MPLLDPERRWAGGMASARPEVAMEPAFLANCLYNMACWAEGSVMLRRMRDC